MPTRSHGRCTFVGAVVNFLRERDRGLDDHVGLGECLGHQSRTAVIEIASPMASPTAPPPTSCGIDTSTGHFAPRAAPIMV